MNPFRPSNLHRRKLCPGSMALEASLPEAPAEDEGNEYQSEGRLLHRLSADKTLDRTGLNPEQLDTIEKSEAMEQEFLKQIEPDAAHPH